MHYDTSVTHSIFQTISSYLTTVQNSIFCLSFEFFFFVQVRRLKEFGVTNGELTRYLAALLKDSEHLAAMVDSVASVDNLEFIMESDALGHTVMNQLQGMKVCWLWHKQSLWKM